MLGCQSHSDKGAEYFRAQEYGQALFHFEKAHALYPNDVYVIHNLARSLEELERFDEAIKYFGIYLEKSTEKLSGFLGRGRCFFGKNYLEGAEIDFTNALRVDQGCFDAYYMRGRTRVKMSLFTEGLGDLNNALTIDKDHVRSHYYRGIGYAAIGLFGAAISDLNFVIDKEPEIVEAYYNRAFCYEQVQNYGRAIQDYNNAIDRKPGYANALAKRGISYLRIGEKESACRDFMLLEKLNDERAVNLLKQYCKQVDHLTRS